MPAWLQIELDTTPPEIAGMPIENGSVGIPYQVEIEFDQVLDAIADVYILDTAGNIFTSEDALGDGNILRASVSLLGASAGIGTLSLTVRDEVWNARTVECPLNIVGGLAVLMEVPEREFGFDLLARSLAFTLPNREHEFDLDSREQDYELPERVFAFELPELG